MAKNNNLKDFLTDIANAIRLRKNTNNPINPQNFSAEIMSIEPGEGVVSKAPNDVNFFDHEGIIHYSYTAEEFLALSDMPPLPTKKGLICQGWNWNWEEAYDYVAEYGILDVGAMFITDDGATRLYIRIANDGRMDVPLCFKQTVSNAVSVDWGDGSLPETFEGTGVINATHTYASMGDYVIRLVCNEGTLSLGSNCVMGVTTTNYPHFLQKVEMGDGLNANFEMGIFRTCRTLNSVSIPYGVTTFQNLIFGETAIVALVVPNSVKNSYTQVFSNCYSLHQISLPNTLKSLGNYSFAGNRTLPRVVIPTSLTAISVRAFSGINSLSMLVIPKTILTIHSEAFLNNIGVRFYDFTHHEQVPILNNVNAFSGIPDDCEIRVPMALLEEWKAATNWCDLADHIVGVGEIEGGNVTDNILDIDGMVVDGVWIVPSFGEIENDTLIL